MNEPRRKANIFIDTLLSPLFGRTGYTTIDGITVPVPKEIKRLAKELRLHNPVLTREQKVSAISESRWAIAWAAGMSTRFNPSFEGYSAAEKAKYTKELARRLAETQV